MCNALCLLVCFVFLQLIYSETLFKNQGLKLAMLPPTQTSDRLINYEYYRLFWPTPLIRLSRMLPKALRPIRPLAKAGIRSYSAPAVKGDAMHKAVGGGGEDGDVVSVGLLVYMFVHPSLRGKGLGDALLEQCLDGCRKQKSTHMLLVHDDQGSGKLIKFYKDRGFKDVSSVLNLDKAMLISTTGSLLS